MNLTEAINQYYSSSASGDWDAWLSLFAPNIVMEDLVGGHFEGIERMEQKVKSLKQGYSQFLMQPLHIVIDGDEGCVVWHFQGKTISGVPIDTKGANYFRFANDKIVYIADFLDTQAFAPFLNQKLNS